MACPFCISCDIDIHLDTLVLSIMSNIDIPFQEQFFFVRVILITKNIPNWAIETLCSSPQIFFNRCPKYFNYLIDDGSISAIGLIIKSFQSLYNFFSINPPRFLVGVGLWQLNVILVTTRFRVTKQCKYQSP
jgi:hypothetical protein